MTSTVESIHEQALDSGSDLADVLSRAIYLASGLRQKPVTNWLKNELDGYTDPATLPAFRRDIPATIVAWFPGQGWAEIPLSESVKAKEGRTNIAAPVREIVRIHRDSRKTGGHRVDLDQEELAEMKRRLNYDTRLTLAVTHEQYARILETVRLVIAYWTADLMELGLTGDAVVFRDDARKQVAPVVERLDDYVSRACEEAPERVAAAKSRSRGLLGRLLRTG